MANYILESKRREYEGWERTIQVDQAERTRLEGKRESHAHEVRMYDEDIKRIAKKIETANKIRLSLYEDIKREEEKERREQAKKAA